MQKSVYGLKVTFFSGLSVIHDISSEGKQRITSSKIMELIYEFATKRGRVVFKCKCPRVPASSSYFCYINT